MSEYEFDINAIQSKFFQPHHIRDYTTNLGNYLTSKKLALLNLEQLRDYLVGVAPEYYRQSVDAFKDRFATKICGIINPRHVTILINKLLLSYNLYQDMLVLADSDFGSDLAAPIDTRLAHLHGFLVVQKGGYEPEPSTYMAKLVCAREGRGSVRRTNVNEFSETSYVSRTIVLDTHGAGTILVGAYLATIKQHAGMGITQLGILELFRGYENLAGFCAYSKFGFAPFLEYRHPRFSESVVELHDTVTDEGGHSIGVFGVRGKTSYIKLPMSVDVASLTMEEIVAAVRTRRRIFRVDKERMHADPIYAELVYTPLCNIRRPVATQAELASLYNKLYVAVYRKQDNKVAGILDEIREAKIGLGVGLTKRYGRASSATTARKSRSRSRYNSGTAIRKTRSMGSFR